MVREDCIKIFCVNYIIMDQVGSHWEYNSINYSGFTRPIQTDL